MLPNANNKPKPPTRPPLGNRPPSGPNSETISRPAAAPMTLTEKLALDNERKAKEAADRLDPRNVGNRRFWLPKGESRFIIILDHSLNDTKLSFSRYEHNSQDEDGKWGNHDWCLLDLGTGAACPLCRKLKKKGTLVAFLTILDFREWKDGKGNTHSYSRTLLPVYGDLLANLLKKEEMVKAKGRTLRGMTLMIERGKEKTAPRTGMPVEFELEGADTPVPWSYATEAEIAQVANNPEVRRDTGEIIKRKGEDMHPFVYRDVFGKPPTADELADAAGIEALPGSSRSAREEWEATEQAPADDDEIPGLAETEEIVREEVEWEEPATEAPPVTTRPVIARPAVSRPLPTRPAPVSTQAPARPPMTRPAPSAPAPVAGRPPLKRPAPRPSAAPVNDPFAN